MSDQLAKLQDILGYRFAEQSLLTMALTHASTSGDVTYERLEFLGDRVLGLATADALYSKFADEPEGDLARRLAALVQGTTLAKIAVEMDLGSFIYLSDAERNAGGGENDHILADVLEALLGAMYLDGGFAACQATITKLWGERFYQMVSPPQHPKTHLQEWAQGKGLSLPAYKIIGQTGPDHAPMFKVGLSVEGFDTVAAEGKSRQEAEKQVAALFMQTYGDK